ncbi:MAG: type II secretion system protein [Candidatus Omnitrophota bacterium]
MGKKGFTVFEVMVVVAIIAFLAAMAVPNLMRSRIRARRQACIVNLRQIDMAKVRYILDGGEADPPEWEDLIPSYMKRRPVCPSAGTYAIGDKETNPACSKSAAPYSHILE